MTTTTTVLIVGNTYPVKDAIKALGGRWDVAAKGWRVPSAVAARAQSLVAGAPRGYVSAPISTASARAPYRTTSRGKWTGCSCGAREMPDGTLSGNACRECRYDHE